MARLDGKWSAVAKGRKESQDSGAGNNIGGVEYLDTGIPGKTRPVECENRSDSVHLHCSHQASVVRRLAVNLKLGYQYPPRLGRWLAYRAAT
jgi:hypothetical protein